MCADAKMKVRPRQLVALRVKLLSFAHLERVESICTPTEPDDLQSPRAHHL
jgi:hypothetical protein